jgi:hypothetical protein
MPFISRRNPRKKNKKGVEIARCGCGGAREIRAPDADQNNKAAREIRWIRKMLGQLCGQPPQLSFEVK